MEQTVRDVQDFILLFTSIFYEALPFIVAGAVIAGLVEEFVPQQVIMRLMPRNVVLATALCALLGLILPMCECGILVIMRRLLRKGLALSSCVAYLLAGPIINPIVLLSTFVAFAPYPAEQMGKMWMVSLRAGLAFLVACGTALIVEWQFRKHGFRLVVPIAVPPGSKHRATAEETQDDEVAEEAIAPSRSLFQRLGNVSETALHDFVDISVFLILGGLLAAFARQVLRPDDVEEFARNFPGLVIAAMMTLAVVICLCSEVDAFMAANIANVTPASKLAFLVLGPMLDLKLYLMYTRVFRPRLIWTIITCVVVQVFVYSLIVNFLWDRFGPTGSP